MSDTLLLRASCSREFTRTLHDFYAYNDQVCGIVVRDFCDYNKILLTKTPSEITRMTEKYELWFNRFISTHQPTSLLRRYYNRNDFINMELFRYR